MSDLVVELDGLSYVWTGTRWYRRRDFLTPHMAIIQRLVALQPDKTVEAPPSDDEPIESPMSVDSRYGALEANRGQVVKILAAKAGHVSEYDWLMAHLSDCDQAGYQRRYRKYWAMNSALLAPSYYTPYFSLLQSSVGISATEIASVLYRTPTYSGGGHSLQFSFATKLAHMHDGRLPIYDRLVSDFYAFRRPDSALPIETRINMLGRFYEFLSREYARVLEEELLKGSIALFREQLRPQRFTDQKIVDSLLWAFATQPKTAGSR